MRFLGLSIAVLLAGTLGAQAQTACPLPKALGFEVTGKITVSIPGFTEGLEVHDHDIYESTGALGGGTRMMRITPTGHVTILNDPDQRYFGEGLTFLGDRVYQLSWQDHLVFVYDRKFKLLNKLHNPNEGWGLTNDGQQLIASDGTPRIFFADPADFHINKTIRVRRGNNEVDQINELEYVDGKLYANLWMTRTIAQINLQTGCIEAEANMSSLWDRLTPQERDYVGSNADYVLNGIAYDPGQKLFYVTGKEWPMIFAGHFTGE